jgi:hypothetical protein
VESDRATDRGRTTDSRGAYKRRRLYHEKGTGQSEGG